MTSESPSPDAQSPSPMNMRTMTLHGDRVAYCDEGTGEVLLLVHGMGGSSTSWREQVPRLSKKYRVIAPDLLGHGQSDKPRGDYSLGAFAVWLRDLLDALGIPKATIVGHSLGGGVALQFAHQHRDYCQRMVLISSGGLGADVGPMLRLMSLPGAELMLPVIASRPVINAGKALQALRSSDGEVTRFSETLRAQASLANRDSRQAFLRTLRAVVDYRGQAVCALNRLHFHGDLPFLIISGEQDRVIPVAHAHAAHAALPNSRLHIIPDVLHHPQVERPDTVAGLIDEFIAGSGEYARPTAVADVVSINEVALSAPTHSRRTEPAHAGCTRGYEGAAHIYPAKSARRTRISSSLRTVSGEGSALRRISRRRAS